MNHHTRPNILLFVADDLGWGDLGCYGATRIPTPHLDALASRGTRFTDAHAASSVCTPSRYGILTGRFPWRSPLQSGVLGGSDPSIIGPDVATIASLLHDDGYHTGAFGKWHLGLNWTELDGHTRSVDPAEPFVGQMQASGRDIDYTLPFAGGPLDLGFERFFGIAGSLDMPPYCFLEGRRVRDLPTEEKQQLVTSQRPGLQSPGWRDEEVDTTIVAQAVEWLDSLPTDTPFFAYVASAAPHRPCVPPTFVQGASEAGPRGDSVVLVDWMVGQLEDTLERRGLLDTTLIVFTSDNGAPTMFPEDGDVVRHRPNGVWRGQKADAYEAGQRVPLIAAGPGILPSTVPTRYVSLLDLLPSLAGHLTPKAVDGSPTLWGAPDSPHRVDAVSAYDGRLSLREGSRKVILGSGSGGFTNPVGEPCRSAHDQGQVYDLDLDPQESDDLWATRQADARAVWNRFVASSGYGSQPGAVHPTTLGDCDD